MDAGLAFPTKTLKDMVQEYERRLIQEALDACVGNQRRAAATLGVLPTTLHEKIKRLGLRSAMVGSADFLNLGDR